MLLNSLRLRADLALCQRLPGHLQAGACFFYALIILKFFLDYRMSHIVKVISMNLCFILVRERGRVKGEKAETVI